MGGELDPKDLPKGHGRSLMEYHNLYIFDTETGRFIGSYDLNTKNLPLNLRSGDFTVLSEFRATALMQKADPEEVRANRIAQIQSGVFSLDSDEWFRNYM